MSMQPPVFLLSFILGFVSLTVQVVLMRELTLIFGGNELSFSAVLFWWLLFGGIGALISSQRRVVLHPSPKNAILFFLTAIILLPLLAMVRSIRWLFGISPGEVMGLGMMHMASLLAACGPAFVLAFLFVRIVERSTEATGRWDLPTRSYFWETAGSGV
jgi:spermidine synthase